ncbi:hypothetical protein RI129_002769 [Pyrocoelia pectoralis]|uniref:Uncharacterized protein n=1 Tax=Pyrocoelia pectoralis TaxID=417401 RepID=A0AAN7VH44_9COLE
MFDPDNFRKDLKWMILNNSDNMKEQCLYCSQETNINIKDVFKSARMIGTSAEEDAAMHVRKETDAQEIWNTLLSVYEQSSLERLYALFDSFFEISKDDATSVTKHMSRLASVFEEDIVQELQKKDPNGTLPLSLLHHRIFKTLGTEYQFYRSTWYLVPPKQQTTNLLIENLRSIESSLMTQEASQTASAFHAKSNQSKNQNKSNTPRAVK